jgi:hypothetical protein
MTTLINPMNETSVGVAKPPVRLQGLEGCSIGLLDISKPGGSIFLDRLENLLKQRYAVGNVVRVSKPTFAKPAPEVVIEKLRAVDAVVEGLAD